MPSSFQSTATGMPPSPSSAAGTDAAVDASIGCTGRPTCSRNSASAGSPPARAAAATGATAPRSMTARRTERGGTPAARATASTMTPSSAPCRSSPDTSDRRKTCSSAVAAPKSSATIRRRSPAEPVPAAPAARSRSRSTAATFSVDSAAAAGRSRSEAQPIPVRRCRSSPESHGTTIATSSGPASCSATASSSTLASRRVVDDTARDTVTTSRRSTPASCLGQDGGSDRGADRRRAARHRADHRDLAERGASAGHSQGTGRPDRPDRRPGRRHGLPDRHDAGEDLRRPRHASSPPRQPATWWCLLAVWLAAYLVGFALLLWPATAPHRGRVPGVRLVDVHVGVRRAEWAADHGARRRSRRPSGCSSSPPRSAICRRCTPRSTGARPTSRCSGRGRRRRRGGRSCWPGPSRASPATATTCPPSTQLGALGGRRRREPLQLPRPDAVPVAAAALVVAGRAAGRDGLRRPAAVARAEP